MDLAEARELLEVPAGADAAAAHIAYGQRLTETAPLPDGAARRERLEHALLRVQVSGMGAAAGPDTASTATDGVVRHPRHRLGRALTVLGVLAGLLLAGRPVVAHTLRSAQLVAAPVPSVVTGVPVPAGSTPCPWQVGEDEERTAEQGPVTRYCLAGSPSAQAVRDWYAAHFPPGHSWPGWTACDTRRLPGGADVALWTKAGTSVGFVLPSTTPNQARPAPAAFAAVFTATPGCR